MGNTEQIINPQRQDAVISYVPQGYARGAPLPWQIKMGLKILLSHIPLPYAFWSSIGIFKHGDLKEKTSALQKGFDDHMAFYNALFNNMPERCLELGPGDSIGHALVARSMGVGGIDFIDVGDFATNDPEHYSRLYSQLDIDEPLNSFDRKTVLDFTNSTYGTNGLQSLGNIAGGSIAFSFSNAVLEHIKRDHFQNYMTELYRVHKNNSVSRHYVDLHDHLGGALNNMRFGPDFWESGLTEKAGFYTNRLIMQEMIDMAENAGFQVSLERIIKWKRLPTPQDTMHPDFQRKDVEDLNVCTFVMVMKK